MAGTVVVDNITTGTGATVPAATVVSGTAKAWVNFNGTGTVAIRAGFNVSSITDLAAGKYQVNFTTAMPDASYAVSTNGATNNAYNQDGIPVSGVATNFTTPLMYTTSVTIMVSLVANGSGHDGAAQVVSVLIFR